MVVGQPGDADGCVSPADARDCVFFMHGILDTSMGWVSNGVTGSQAFAAYDQGFDVWLGNSRANPPRVLIGADDACAAPHAITKKQGTPAGKLWTSCYIPPALSG